MELQDKLKLALRTTSMVATLMLLTGCAELSDYTSKKTIEPLAREENNKDKKHKVNNEIEQTDESEYSFINEDGYYSIGEATYADINNFFAMMHEDEEWNGISIYWDGTMGTEVEDEQDTLETENPRQPVNGRTTIDSDKITLRYPDKYQFNLIEKSLTGLHLRNAEFDIDVQEVDFDEAKELMSDSDDYTESAIGLIYETEAWKFSRWETYLRVVYYPEAQNSYAGYVTLVESKVNNKAYTISVTGIGNIEDIKQMAYYITNGFKVDK